MVLVDTRGVVPVSVTADFCPMNCKHCGGVYLKHMITVNEMERYAKKGAKVFLISGGMLKDGRIPFERYLEKLQMLKERYNLRYNFHIGFPKSFPIEVDKLADVISADFFADPAILKEIYGIYREPEEILGVMKSFKSPVVPHLTIGILCGRITHEYKALDILSKHYEWIVLNVFVPTPQTHFEGCMPPSVEDVVKIFKEAKRRFNTVFLGCMQPRGVYRYHLQKGLDFINGITKPVIKSYEGAKTVSDCCAFQVIREHQASV